jgi:hypothetical protein
VSGPVNGFIPGKSTQGLTEGGVNMETIPWIFDQLEPLHSKHNFINTTLYEIIETIAEEVEPGEEGMVTEAVLELLASRKAKFLSPPSDVKIS